MKLNQLIAVLQSVKANASKSRTEVYQLCQKKTLFQGLSRTYQSREEDGFIYPPEAQKLTLKADELVEKFIQSCSEFLDLAATQDYANFVPINLAPPVANNRRDAFVFILSAYYSFTRSKS